MSLLHTTKFYEFHELLCVAIREIRKICCLFKIIAFIYLSILISAVKAVLCKRRAKSH